MQRRLMQIMESLPASKVLLVGDLMLDKYLFGNAERLSPDAPVPVLHYQREDARLGGAGRVAADLAMLGAQVRVVSVVGRDSTGDDIRRMLTAAKVNVDSLIVSENRPTTSKVRLVGLAQHRHPQQMMRVDYEDVSDIDSPTAARVLQHIEAGLNGAAALCIEDYNKGLLTPSLCLAIIELARRKGVQSFVDPALIKDYSKYKGASAITPNRTEASTATGLPCTSEEQYRATAERLLSDLNLDAAILTLDKSGAYLASRDGERQWLKTRERKVYDVSGAGDMVLAMLAVARAAGANWPEAVALGNIAGGLEVEKFGSVPITPMEITAELLRESRQQFGKRRTGPELQSELARHRATGKKIVFTNGCFDLITLGHVKYFQFAKRQGDVLVVGVNTDSCIHRLKGPKRPIVSEDDRLGVLEEFESIDYLIQFDEDTPIELIKKVRPDVLVKGADYTKEQVVGWDFVESYGGQVALAPLIDGKSTSSIIQQILKTHTPPNSTP